MENLTHIETKRREYASNQQHIQTELGWSTEKYFFFIVELGCSYLEDQYPNEMRYKNHYEMIAYHPDYWDWFHVEYKLAEADYLRTLNKFHTPTEERTFKGWMQTFTEDRFSDIHLSFNHNYIKHLEQIY